MGNKYSGLVLDVARQRSGAEPGAATLLDHSRYGHDGTMTDVTWTQLPSGMWVPVFNGSSARVTMTGASTPDMNFTTQDYSVACWVKWQSDSISQIIIGRYVLDNNGWEIYLTETGGVFSLTTRQHHAGTIVDTHPRSAYNSDGWALDTWHQMVITRSGNLALHYKNGVSLATTFSTGGLTDAESCTQAVAIGIRYTLDANWLNGNLAFLQIYNHVLSPPRVRSMFSAKRSLFGV